MDFKVKKYRNNFDYSYALGMAPTIELIKYRKEDIYKVFIHPDYIPKDDIDIFEICKNNNLEYEISKKVFNRISSKGNIFVIGVFFKYTKKLNPEKPHVVLVNPSDAGNLGTILRTGLGFNFNNVAIITPAVDIYNPNTIRASMGAMFRTNFEFYNSIEEYINEYKNHRLYSFMLNGKNTLKNIQLPKDNKFSLVFGNEASGLDDKFLDLGESLLISHSDKIDSLNLSIAFGIAAHHFSDL